MRLRNSYVDRNLSTQYEKFTEGVRLVQRSEFLASDKRADAYICAFEGLGWIHLSGFTKSDTAAMCISIAKRVLSSEPPLRDWRLSAEQHVIYAQIAQLFFLGNDLERVIENLSQADEVSSWVSSK